MSRFEKLSEGITGISIQAVDRLVNQGIAERMINNAVRFIATADPEKVAQVEEDHGRRFEELREKHLRRQEEASRRFDREGWRVDF